MNKTHATLPENLEAAAIDTMMTGEVAYTVPWAMWVDTQRRCWLHPKYTTHETPHGTVEMRIELRQDGYHVWPPAGATWDMQEDHSYFGGGSIEFIPVIELHP